MTPLFNIMIMCGVVQAPVYVRTSQLHTLYMGTLCVASTTDKQDLKITSRALAQQHSPFLANVMP